MGLGTIEQAQQARQELAQKNSKIIHQLPPELLVAGKPIRIFNVTPQKWEVSQGGLGTWTIPACEPGQKYSEPKEVPFIMNEGIPVDMDHIEFRAMAGGAFANSILGIGPFRHPTEDLRRHGIFIAAGDVPTEAELAEANRHFQERDLDLVRQADGFYGDGPGEYKNITKQHRDALDRCVERGMDIEERPWHKPLKSMAECPVCFAKVDPRAIVHIGPNGCGGVINEPAVIKAKLRGYEHLWKSEKAEKPEKAEKGAQPGK